MYIEFGPVKKTKRFQFSLKVGKGKVIATSPSYGSRATAFAKAKKLMARVEGCDTIYELAEFKS